MKPFLFRHFSVVQANAAMKVGTDSMLLGSLCDFPGKQNILDIGAGTGVLSLMVAQRFSPVKITSVEIDAAAFSDLETNLGSSPFTSTHFPVSGNILKLRFEEKFDGIISNPPFFEDSTKNAHKQQSTARHTDELSFEDLFLFVTDNISEDGLFWLIIPHDANEKLGEIGKSHQLYLNTHIILEGKAGKPVRSIMCFSKTQTAFSEQTFIIRKDNGSYTEEYIRLTKDFHGVALKS